MPIEWISETARNDGLYIFKRGANWLIKPGKAREVEVCPCCNKPFASQRAARLTANVLYPMNDETAHSNH